MTNHPATEAPTEPLSLLPASAGRRLFLQAGAAIGVAHALALAAPFAAQAAPAIVPVTTAVDRPAEPVDIYIYDPAGVALLPDESAWRVLAFAPMNLRLHVHRASASLSAVCTIEARLRATGLGSREVDWLVHRDRRWSTAYRSAPLLSWLAQWEDERQRGWDRW